MLPPNLSSLPDRSRSPGKHSRGSSRESRETGAAFKRPRYDSPTPHIPGAETPLDARLREGKEKWNELYMESQKEGALFYNRRLNAFPGNSFHPDGFVTLAITTRPNEVDLPPLPNTELYPEFLDPKLHPDLAKLIKSESDKSELDLSEPDLSEPDLKRRPSFALTLPLKNYEESTWRGIDGFTVEPEKLEGMAKISLLDLGSLAKPGVILKLIKPGADAAANTAKLCQIVNALCTANERLDTKAETQARFTLLLNAHLIPKPLPLTQEELLKELEYLHAFDPEALSVKKSDSHIRDLVNRLHFERKIATFLKDVHEGAEQALHLESGMENDFLSPFIYVNTNGGWINMNLPISLLHSVRQGWNDMVELCLKRRNPGSDLPEALKPMNSVEQQQVLNWAVQVEKTDIMDFLIKTCNIIPDTTTLVTAAKSEQWPLFQKLKDQYALPPDESITLSVAQTGNWELAEKLVAEVVEIYSDQEFLEEFLWDTTSVCNLFSMAAEAGKWGILEKLLPLCEHVFGGAWQESEDYDFAIRDTKKILHLAVQAGQLELLDLCLAMGFIPTQETFLAAVGTRNMEILQLMRDYYSGGAYDAEREYFRQAIEKSDIDSVKWCLDNGMQPKLALYITALDRQNTEITNLLRNALEGDD